MCPRTAAEVQEAAGRQIQQLHAESRDGHSQHSQLTKTKTVSRLEVEFGHGFVNPNNLNLVGGGQTPAPPRLGLLMPCVPSQQQDKMKNTNDTKAKWLRLEKIHITISKPTTAKYLQHFPLQTATK
eukprot:scaffold355_cov127-Skeletonema_dohrnii-CCMP3373.AAC.3